MPTNEQNERTAERSLAGKSPGNAQIARNFLRIKRASGTATATLKNYAHLLAALDRFTTARDLRSIVAADVTGFLDERGRRLAPSTIHHSPNKLVGTAAWSQPYGKYLDGCPPCSWMLAARRQSVTPTGMPASNAITTPSGGLCRFNGSLAYAIGGIHDNKLAETGDFATPYARVALWLGARE